MLDRATLKLKLLNTDLFIDNEYFAKYLDLMCTSETNIKTGYSEWHHILQKQYFKLKNLPVDNTQNNKVLLLYKDHCKAHWLLYHCTINELKRANAAAVQYILNVYNNLNITNKTQEKLCEADFNIMQQYYEDIKNCNESKYYSTEEIIFLKENYPKYGTKYCANYLGRTVGSVHEEVTTKLNLKRDIFWTDEKVLFLRENYEIHGGAYCADYLHTTKKIIFKKAKRLGLTRNNTRKAADSWTDEELSVLKQYYPTDGSMVYLRLQNRSYTACRCMASTLDIKCEHTNPSQWNSEDTALLQANINKPICEIIVLLPNRTESSIRHKIERLRGK